MIHAYEEQVATRDETIAELKAKLTRAKMVGAGETRAISFTPLVPGRLSLSRTWPRAPRRLSTVPGSLDAALRGPGGQSARS